MIRENSSVERVRQFVSSKQSLVPPLEQQRASAPVTTRRFRIRASLSAQILLATLIAGLLPLLLISFSALEGFNTASQETTDAAVAELDAQAIRALQTRTQEVARSLSGFLEARVDDTLSARLLPVTLSSYIGFYYTHMGELHVPTGKKAAPQDTKVDQPIFSEVAFIDASGQELIHIVDGHAITSDKLRNVSNPANTTYRSETYFAETRALPVGKVYISPVTAWHTSSELQPAGRPDPHLATGANYGTYKAVVRFGTPVVDARGQFSGMVVLSVDHRFIMEHSMHVMPVSNESWTLYPDYQSGNYAYIFDSEGYTIAHPLLSRIRGLDSQGKLVPSMHAGLSEQEMERYAFNMREAAWSDPRLPEVVNTVLRQEDGFFITTNQAGAQKASTYAPIRIEHGVDQAHRIFGGVIIGANTSEFHRAATEIRDHIGNERAHQQTTMIEIIAIGIVLLVAASIMIARSITQPIRLLIGAAQAIEDGAPENVRLSTILNRRRQDEVTKLASVFDGMAREVQLREQKLKEQITQLHIQVDEQKKNEHVAEITETPYFQDLQQRAKNLRIRRDVGGRTSNPSGTDGHE